MNKVKKRSMIVSLAILAVVVFALLAFLGLYFTRIQTIGSIERLTDYADGYNLYRMDIKYDYNLENIIDYGIQDDQTMIDAILKEALPLLPVKIKAPNFGCTVFCLTDTDGDVHMGRNYDFSKDTSAMLVYCAPKDGYKSIAFAALDNVSANVPDENIKKELASLTAPFICLDGMNEKGVSIAVLTLDSEPVRQSTGKPVISTTLAIRLVLDRAATTEEAVELLRSYDMFASSGRDYHFYITDASGDGRVIEYDINGEPRELIDTPSEAVTNFFIRLKDEVLPNQKNGIYGHGSPGGVLRGRDRPHYRVQPPDRLQAERGQARCHLPGQPLYRQRGKKGRCAGKDPRRVRCAGQTVHRRGQADRSPAHCPAH